MAIPSSRRLSSVALFIYLLLAFVIGGYLYFSQFHIPQREANLVDQGVRTLANIEERIAEYEGFLGKTVEQRVAADIVLKNSRIFGIEKDTFKLEILQEHLQRLPIDSIPKGDSIFKGDSLWDVSLFFKNSQKDPEIRVRVKSPNELKSFLDSLSAGIDGKEGDENNRKYRDSLKPILFADPLKTYFGVVDLSDFMTNIAKNEMFECLVLQVAEKDKNRIIYSDHPRIISPTTAFSKFKKDTLSTKYGVNVVPTAVNSKEYIEFAKPILLAGKPLILSGFIDKKSFENYKKEIDYRLLIFIILTTMILLSAVSLIKVFVLNKWERLKGGDAVLSGLALIATIFFATLLYSSTDHYRELNLKVEDDLEEFAQGLKSSFSGELAISLQSALNIDKEDTRILFHERIQLIPEDTLKIKQLYFPYREDSASLTSNKKDFVAQLFSHFTDLSERDYVKKIKSDNIYKFNPSDSLRSQMSSNPDFYIQSVFSYLRAENEAVISVYDDNDMSINALAFDFKSLMWNKMPEGVGFAVVNRDLEVMFSSRKARNNFKDLKTDISGGDFMRSAAIFETASHGIFEYGKDEYKGFITPIECVIQKNSGKSALYLLVFADEDMLEWQTSITAILSGTISFTILIVSLLFLYLSYVFSIRRRDKPFFEANPLYDLLYPKAYERKVYLFFIGFAFLSCIAGCFIYACGLESLWTYAISQMLFFGVLRSYLLTYPVGEIFKKRIFYFLLVSLALITVPYAIRYQYGSTPFVSVMDWIWWVFLILSFFMAVAIKSRLPKSDEVNAYEQYPPRAVWSKTEPEVGRECAGVRKWYPVSVWAWILCTLVVPFMLIANKCEDIVHESFQDYSYEVFDDDVNKGVEDLKERYGKYRSFESENSESKLRGSISLENNFFSMLQSEVKKVEDTPWAHLIENTFFSSQVDRYSYAPKYNNNNNNFLSSVLKSRAPLKVVSFICFVGVLLLLIRAYGKKVIFNIPYELHNIHDCKKAVINGIKKYVEIRKPLQPKLFVVGVPRSRRMKILKKLGYNNLEEIGVIDFGRDADFLNDYTVSKIPPALISARVIVVRHCFPECIDDEYFNQIKNLTRCLNSQMLASKPIVIISDLGITQLEERWFKMEMKDESNCEATRVIVYLKEWLRDYREFVLPINLKDFEDSISTADLINVKSFDNEPAIPDSQSYQVYLNKSYYAPVYFSIWNSLSYKERFILYDLAEDGMVNAKDTFLLMKLRLKGLIYYNPITYRLELFQESFRLFVNNGVSVDELIKLEALTRKFGSWGQIRTALFLLIVALMFFIYQLLPNIFNALAGAIAAVGSLSGAVSQLSGNARLSKISGWFKKT